MTQGVQTWLPWSLPSRIHSSDGQSVCLPWYHGTTQWTGDQPLGLRILHMFTLHISQGAKGYRVKRKLVPAPPLPGSPFGLFS